MYPLSRGPFLFLSVLLHNIPGVAGQADLNDPYDLSFLVKGAAIGDSYAAGIGAGNQVNWGCSRYDGSYASLVSLQLGVDPKTQDFTYTACSGAVISGVVQQANGLLSGQQYIIISAGGNDADLVGILNSCVYSFLGGLSHPNCDKKLAESRGTIQNNDFASKVDNLISIAKSKLSSDGNIYYVGYAKFFDTTDNGCDSVSWHFWLNLFTREFLTQARRQSMNDLVDLMNGALRDAATRAGDQVHFIDYDQYVDMTRGRYCQPGDDESGGKSANREDLFFYEMMSVDSPWLTPERASWSPDLRRRQNTFNDDGDIQPENNTLNALYGALLQEAFEDSSSVFAIQDDNANNDLEEEIHQEEELLGLSERALAPLQKHKPVLLNKRQISAWNVTRTLGLSVSPSSSSQQTSVPTPTSRSGAPRLPTMAAAHQSAARSMSGILRSSSSPLASNQRTISSLSASGSGAPRLPALPASIVQLGTQITAARLYTNLTSTNTTILRNNAALGTIIANQTHVLLGNSKVVKKVNLKKLIVSDTTSRVFHPTQSGHSLIANLILYTMTAQRAKVLGIADFPEAVANTTGAGSIESPGPACNTQASATWANRDAMISALSQFCADPSNLRGIGGSTTSEVFNANSFDYLNISIAWASTASLGEHSCSAWLDIVTDSCDVPSPSGANAGNWKHGGTITYQSLDANATLSIEPLVMRRIWDKGQAGGQQCNDIDSLNYLDQATLQGNINDYCAAFAKQAGGIANSGSTFSQTYNDGTPDRVTLTTSWPSGPRNYQIFQDECQYYMSVINNGCSLPSDSNPLNWKHGGSLTDKNGIEYTIAPTQTRPPPPSAPVGGCSVSNQGWGYVWSVQGGGFASGDWGANLLSQIKGCGAVTSWTFIYYSTPQTNGAEWIAGGTLPLIVKSHCLARAIKSAGGYPSNC